MNDATDYGHPMPMWQTKYDSAVPKNMGVGVNLRLCSEDYFLSWHLKSVNDTKLVKYDQGCRLHTSKINFESFRTFRDPVFLEQISGRELHFGSTVFLRDSSDY